jgi:hypothetical protein
LRNVTPSLLGMTGNYDSSNMQTDCWGITTTAETFSRLKWIRRWKGLSQKHSKTIRHNQKLPLVTNMTQHFLRVSPKSRNLPPHF